MLLLLVCVPALAQDLQQSLKKEYVDKILLIRGFYQDNYLHFAEDGTLQNSGHPGSWTTAAIHITNIKFKHGSVEINGERIAEVMQNSAFVPMRMHTTLTIAIDEPNQDEQAIRTSLAKVLVDSKVPLVDIVPEYWHDVLAKDQSKESLYAPMTDAKKKNGCIAPSLDAPCCLGGDVIPPKEISTPYPIYPDLPKQIGFEGSPVLWFVVDETGTPQRIQIANAIGFGFDDAAVEAVRHWKYEPATENGKAVPVRVQVGVNFRRSTAIPHRPTITPVH